MSGTSREEPHQLFRRLATLVLPGVLLLLLFGVLRAAEEKVWEWRGQRYEQRLRREAVRYEETIRATYAIEAQLTRFNRSFRQRLARRLMTPRREFRAAPDGRTLRRVFQRSFPPEFHDTDSVLFAFARSGNGPFKVLSGPGLATANGRIMASLLGFLCDEHLLSPRERKSAQKRCEGIFGGSSPFEFLAPFRRAVGNLVQFQEKRCFLIWDSLDGKDGISLGYLVILPVSRVHAGRPLIRALNIRLPGERLGGLPVLVPVANPCRPARPISASRPHPAGLAPLLRSLSHLPDRDRRFPNHQLIREGNLYLYRGFLSLNSLFELWVVFPRESPESPVRGNLSAHLAGGFLLVLWLVGARFLIFREPPSVSLRLWFPGIIALTGLLPLSTLYLVGSMQIEISQIRETQTLLDRAQERLKQIDRGNAALRLKIASLGNRLLADETWRVRIEAPSLEAFEEAASRAFDLFRGEGYPLKRAIAFPVDGHPRMRVDSRLGTQVGSMTTMSAYETVFQGVRDAFRIVPTASRSSGGGGDTRGIQKLFSAIGLSFVGGGRGPEIIASALGGTIFSIVHTRMELAFIDFLADHGKPHTFLTLVPDNTVQVRWMRQFLIRENRGEALPSLVVLGQGTIRGFQSWYPLPRDRYYSRFWHLRTAGVPLRRVLDRAVQNNSRQVEETPQDLFLAFPCEEAPGNFLGHHVSLAGVQATVARRTLVLRGFILVLGAFILLLGLVTARHLIQPLTEVELGLLRVSSGDLTVRVGLQREDELGFLTAAFDDMTRGLKRRQELGRFVSGTLDSALAEGLVAPKEPAVRPGAVLVSDLRSFTTLAEQHPPRDVVTMLNTHLEAMSLCIQARGGLIEKFIGDAIVAVFYDAQEGAGVGRALQAAADMRRRHLDLQSARTATGAFTYEMGVGIDVGPILSGALHSAGRKEFAVLGNARRRAEILESQSRQGSHTRILLSSEAVTAVRAERPDLRFLPLAAGHPWELAALPRPQEGKP